MKVRFDIGAIAAVAAIALLGILAPGAAADTTHPFLFKLTPAGLTEPEPVDVDAAGNLYVWDSLTHVLGKFDPAGNPVDFSALGTHILDGTGGTHCATVPADCDRVPSNGFTNETGELLRGVGRIFGSGNVVAVDHSGGVTDGYIYVENRAEEHPGTVEVFDSSGLYRGELNLAIAGPRPTGEKWMFGIDVDSNGHVYVLMSYFSTGHGFVDQFAPTDGDPAHDVFVGQLRTPDYEAGKDPENVWPRGLAVTPAFTYIRGAQCAPGECWYKYPAAQYFLPGNQTGTALQPPPIFRDGGNDFNKAGAVDDSNGDLYLLGSGRIEQWAADGQQVGPDFGQGHVGFFAANTLTVDGSGTATDGRVYAADELTPFESPISVFGPPVIIPDVLAETASAGHGSARVSATIGTAGGGAVVTCEVQYGTTSSLGKKAPCEPPAPYLAPETAVKAELTGLATETDYHYRVVVANANGTNSGPDQVFRTKAVLGLSTDEVSDLAPSSATLHGTLDPDNLATSFHFDYGIDTGYGQSTPTGTLPGGAGAAPVSPAVINGLQPGRTYHFRLVATNALGTTFGADRSFRTPRAPLISSVSATNVSADSADISAQIDPFGSPVSYRFEYGTSAAYGSSTPVPDGSLASTEGTQEVSAHLSDLQPGVTYHFRVLATSPWGTSVGADTTFDFLPPNCPNSIVRQQTSSSYLPDCRAYELVSPGEPTGVQFFAGDGLPQVNGFPRNEPQNLDLRSSPARFSFYGALGTVAGTNAPNDLLDFYVASRTTDGWVTKYPGQPGDQALFVLDRHCSAGLTECYDFHEGIADPNFSIDPSDVGSSVAYRWDSQGNSLGRLPNVSAAGADEYEGDRRASADFSHFAFSSNNVRFYPGGRLVAPGSVYDNDVANETVELVSYLPNGASIPQDTALAHEYLKVPALSRDGSHILISAVRGGGTHLYMRVDDAVSYDVTGPRVATFVGMSEDGSAVYFTSAEKVTGDDHDTSVDLFRWSEETNSLTRISKGNGQGDTNACTTWFVANTCSVQMVKKGSVADNYLAAKSGDIYFYSPEQLDPARPAIPNAMNLYAYREGSVHLVTTLDANRELTRLQVSPQGDHAAFLTASRLSGYDNHGFEEMYSYEPGSGEIACVSCVPDGSPPTADVRASASGLFMADDGRTFFSTADPLVEKDSNGHVTDVYEFTSGGPRLISAGTGSIDEWGGGLAIYPAQTAGLEAVSPDGADVYFSSFDTLVSSDHNGPFLKFYDARTGGGFAPAVQALPCEAADECHGPGSERPGAVPIGTASQLGAGGNAAAPAKARHHKKKQKKRKGTKRAKRPQKRAAGRTVR